MSNIISWKTVLSHPTHFVAFGFGIGLIPKIPGTAGTILAIPIYLLLQDIPVLSYLGVVLFLALLGICTAHYSSHLLGINDPAEIVIDEVVGMLLAFTALPANWLWITLTFIVFRIFDIFKPWPISWIDKNIKGGIGIMLDDIMAGLFTLFVMQIIFFLL